MNQKKSIFKLGLFFGLILSLLFVTACSSGAAYPRRAIEGVVPFGAGGGTDLISRAIAAVAEKELGQPINIVNKPGATATVGTQYVYDKKSDGYTLLFSAENPGIYEVLDLSSLGFKDFYPVQILGRGIPVILVNGESKYETLEQLLDDVRANPGQVKLGTSGPGGISYMVTTMLNQSASAEFNMVPFDGDGPITTALLGNHIDVSINSLTSALENIKAGKFRALAVVNDTRVEQLPDVPAITEVLPEMEPYMPWGPFYGVWVKKDTPDDVKETLVEAFSNATKDADYLALLEQMAVIPMGITGEEAEAFWRDWQSVSAWVLYDAGAAKVSPEELGIPRKE